MLGRRLGLRVALTAPSAPEAVPPTSLYQTCPLTALMRCMSGRTHRGADPDDRRLFGPEALPRLRAAVEEVSWLLGRGYPMRLAVETVGDHHQLEARQRLGGAPFETEVDLVPDPDVLLAGMAGVVSSDGLVLDRCAGWINLAAEIVVPGAWIVDLEAPAEERA